MSFQRTDNYESDFNEVKNLKGAHAQSLTTFLHDEERIAQHHEHTLFQHSQLEHNW